MDILTRWARGQWDRIASWVAFGTAAVLLVLGWRGTSDAVFPAEQIPYLVSGGLGALLLCAVGATLWLSADLRDEWRKLDEIHEEMRAHSAALAERADPGENGDAGRAARRTAAGSGSSGAASRRPRAEEPR